MPLSRMSCLLGLGLAAWMGMVSGAIAQLDAEDLSPGLVLDVKDAETRVRKVVPDLTLLWGDRSPDPRIGADGFRAEVVGFLLIQQPGDHRFHVETDGRVVLTLDGHPIVPGRPVRLDPGPRRLSLEYEHRRGEARIKLNWEGPGFGIEPVPARLLFHMPNHAPAGSDVFNQGRQLADRLACANCHDVLNLPKQPEVGPPLDDFAATLSPAWLRAKLENTQGGHTGFQGGDVFDIIAFLTRDATNRKPPVAELRMGLNVADPSKGRTLYRSLGCLGCHQDRESRTVEVARLSDLTGVGGKRGIAAIAEFLVHPRGAKSSRHRPSLKITPDEAAHLAAYLAGDKAPGQAAAFEKGDPARGRTLVDSARCASCHSIKGLSSPNPKRIPLGRVAVGCLEDSPGRVEVPRFILSAGERDALRAFISQLANATTSIDEPTLAADQVRRLGCLGCHSRDGAGGERIGTQLATALATDPDLNRLKGTLTPPNLTAVADKLRPEALTAVLEGKAPTPRPWLSVRMPHFGLPPAEIARLARVWRDHDASPPAEAPPRVLPLHHDTAVTLIGQKGFGCLSCHVLAGKVPPGGEPETLGPDLALAPTRMNTSYFRRWLTNPQRILVGTPMPQFLKPIESLPGDLEAQRGAIWALLSDPKLPELAAMGTRQILKVEGDRAQVVRDMVLVEGLPGGPYVPRGLAIGFKNGRSLLFDTDRLVWLAGWKGGFLSRTKSGRLWEWHPEGKLDPLPDRIRPPLVFKDATSGNVVGPVEVRERYGRFDEFEFVGNGAVLRYSLYLRGGKEAKVKQTIEPDGDALKWQIQVEGATGLIWSADAERLLSGKGH